MCTPIGSKAGARQSRWSLPRRRPSHQHSSASPRTWSARRRRQTQSSSQCTRRSPLSREDAPPVILVAYQQSPVHTHRAVLESSRPSVFARAAPRRPPRAMFDGVKPGLGLGVRKAASRASAGSDAAPKAATPSTSAMIRRGTHKPYLCCLHAWLRLGSSSAPCASSSVVSTGTTPRFTRASVACQRICAFPALHKHAQACEHL